MLYFSWGDGAFRQGEGLYNILKLLKQALVCSSFYYENYFDNEIVRRQVVRVGEVRIKYKF